MKASVPCLLFFFALTACSSTKETYERGWIGGRFENFEAELTALIENPNVGEHFNERKKAVFVRRIFDHTPSKQAGLREGDLLLRLKGRRLKSSKQLQAAIDTSEPGDQLRGQLLRDGKLQSFALTIGRERYQHVGNFSFGLHFSTQADLWPNPSFSLFSLLEYRQCHRRLELREPRRELLKKGAKAKGMISREGSNINLGLFGLGRQVKVLSQTP